MLLFNFRLEHAYDAQSAEICSDITTLKHSILYQYYLCVSVVHIPSIVMTLDLA